MTLLIIVIIIGLIWSARSIGFNFGSILGGIIGIFLGSSIGIAGSGGAASGVIIFGAIGFVVGGMIFKNINS